MNNWNLKFEKKGRESEKVKCLGTDITNYLPGVHVEVTNSDVINQRISNK